MLTLNKLLRFSIGIFLVKSCADSSTLGNIETQSPRLLTVKLITVIWPLENTDCCAEHWTHKRNYYIYMLIFAIGFNLKLK